MNDKVKISIIAVLVVVGTIVIMKSRGGSSGNGEQESAQNSALVAEGSATSQGESAAALDPAAAKAAAGATADIDRIAEIAKVSMDEAMITYQNYAGLVIREGAKNRESLNRLLNATVQLSEIDGANDHYMSLIEVSDKFPAEFKAGVNAMNASQTVKNEILDTAKSASASLKNGNG